jgi:hypothetical protein
MHTILENDDLFTVGHYNPHGKWIASQDFADYDDAGAFCSWLNGGLYPELAIKLMDSLKIGGGLNK